MLTTTSAVAGAVGEFLAPVLVPRPLPVWRCLAAVIETTSATASVATSFPSRPREHEGLGDHGTVGLGRSPRGKSRRSRPQIGLPRVGLEQKRL